MKRVHSLSGAGVVGTVAPAAPSGCADCGLCAFGPSSYLAVSKLVPSCVLGSLVFTPVSETWAFVSVNGTRARWQKDASNWAEWSCTNNRWTFDSPDVDTTALGCVTSTAAGYLLTFPNPCTGFYFHRMVNGADVTLLTAVVMNNICTPSIPVE